MRRGYPSKAMIAAATANGSLTSPLNTACTSSAHRCTRGKRSCSGLRIRKIGWSERTAVRCKQNGSLPRGASLHRVVQVIAQADCSIGVHICCRVSRGEELVTGGRRGSRQSPPPRCCGPTIHPQLPSPSLVCPHLPAHPPTPRSSSRLTCHRGLAAQQKFCPGLNKMLLNTDQPFVACQITAGETEIGVCTHAWCCVVVNRGEMG